MSDEEVRVHLAEPEDAEKVLKLMRQLVKESDTFTVDPALGELTIPQEHRQILLINQTRGNVILLAQRSDEFIGVVTVQRIDDSNYGELGVAILKSYWNHGLGTALVQEALYWGQQYSNLSALVLTVEKTNAAAIAVYHKCGFRPNHRNRLIKVDGSARSTIEMIHRIQK